MNDASTHPPLRLRAYLGARLRPLAVLVATIVATAAPAAAFVLGRRALEIQTAAAARQIADFVRSDAEQRPTLWKYDALKLIGHLRSYEIEESIVRTLVSLYHHRIEYPGNPPKTDTRASGTPALQVPDATKISQG